MKGNVIEYVFDGQSNLPTPKITKEQYDAAYKYMQGMIEVQLKDEYKETPYNKPRPSSGGEGVGSTTPSAPITERYKSAIKQKSGLNNSTFSNTMSTTIDNIRTILSQVPGGLSLSVEPGDKDGIVNIKKGDAIVKTFNVYKIDPPTQTKYVNEFTELLANLPDLESMAIYVQGTQQTGGINYSDL